MKRQDGARLTGAKQKSENIDSGISEFLTVMIMHGMLLLGGFFPIVTGVRLHLPDMFFVTIFLLTYAGMKTLFRKLTMNGLFEEEAARDTTKSAYLGKHTRKEHFKRPIFFYIDYFLDVLATPFLLALTIASMFN